MSKKTKQQRGRRAHRIQRQVNQLQWRLAVTPRTIPGDGGLLKELLATKAKLQAAEEQIAAMRRNNLDTDRDPVITVRRATHPGYARSGQMVGFQVYLNSGELSFMVREEMRKEPFVNVSRVFRGLQYDVMRNLEDIFKMAVEQETGMGAGYGRLKG